MDNTRFSDDGLERNGYILTEDEELGRAVEVMDEGREGPIMSATGLDLWSKHFGFGNEVSTISGHGGSSDLAPADTLSPITPTLHLLHPVLSNGKAFLPRILYTSHKLRNARASGLRSSVSYRQKLHNHSRERLAP